MALPHTRNRTYVALMQLPPADMNDIQDGIVDHEKRLGRVLPALPGIGTAKTLTLTFGGPIANGSDEWEAASGSTLIWQQKTPTGTFGALVMPVTLPQLSNLVITRFRARVKGGAGHSSMPQYKPSVLFMSKAFTAEVPDPLASMLDPAADVATYETARTLESDPMSLPLELGSMYAVQVIGEAGTNALAGYQLIGAQVDIDEAPAS